MQSFLYQFYFSDGSCPAPIQSGPLCSFRATLWVMPSGGRTPRAFQEGPDRAWSSLRFNTTTCPSQCRLYSFPSDSFGDGNGRWGPSGGVIPMLWESLRHNEGGGTLERTVSSLLRIPEAVTYRTRSVTRPARPVVLAKGWIGRVPCSLGLAQPLRAFSSGHGCCKIPIVHSYLAL